MPLFVLCAAGCTVMPWSAPRPAPDAVAGDRRGEVAAAPAAVVVESLVTVIVPPPEVLLDERAAADSAADAAVLEKLATAVAPGADLPLPEADPNAPPVGLASLDLTTYAGHERVQYYLSFFQGPARDRMAVWLTRLPVYAPMIRERFAAEGLPEDLLYLGLIESGYSNVAVSRSRAVGMWQFMLGTGRWMGLRVDSWVDERRDPVKATDAAARYLRYLSNKFGSVYLAAAAYNGGPGTVSRGLARVSTGGPASDQVAQDPEGWSDADFFTLADSRYLRAETKDYVPKLIAAALIARNPVTYGFEAIPEVEPFTRDSIVVSAMTGLDVLAEAAGLTLAELKELNPHLIRATTPNGRSTVRVPPGTAARVAEAYASLPPGKRVRVREHVVRKGETLGGIAGRYGVGLSALRDANPGVGRNNLIRVGQRLVIPGSGSAGAASAPSSTRPAATNTARTHLVRRGETLSGLAQRYNVSVQALMNANRLRSPTALKAGTRIRIPSA